MTEFEHDWLAPATVMPPLRPSRGEARLRNRLEEKLDDMKLHKRTWEPGDVGYQMAVDELLAWLDNEA